MDLFLSFVQKYLVKQAQHSSYSSLCLLAFLLLSIFTYWLRVQQKQSAKSFEKSFQTFEQIAKETSRATLAETAEAVLEAKAELKARKRFIQQANKQCLAIQTEIYNQIACARAEIEAQLKVIAKTVSESTVN